jgi:aspartate 1-decarboxylase
VHFTSAATIRSELALLAGSGGADNIQITGTGATDDPWVITFLAYDLANPITVQYTLDAALMEAADLLEGEQVAIVDITNGARIETYVIPGPAGTGIIGINGAAAHLVHPGDLVIIMSYAVLDDAEARALKPTVVHVDEHNQVVKIGNDAAEPVPGSDQKRGDFIAAS